MRRLPLFVQTPFTSGLDDWLYSSEQNELYASHSFNFDSDLFPLFLEAKPCVIMTSIHDEASKDACFRFLKQFKEYRVAQGLSGRDPGVRIVVIAEGRQVPGVVWPEFGVYELMVAPILANVLSYKLSRHYHKAIAAENNHESVKVVDEGVLTKLPPSKSSHGFHEWRVSKATPEPPKEKELRKITVKVSSEKFLNPEVGEWKKSDEPESPEERWQWNIRNPKVAAEENKKLFFTGDRPVYDSQLRVWQFTAEEPKLYLNKDETEANELLLDYFAPVEETPTLRVNPKLDVKEVQYKTFMSHVLPKFLKTAAKIKTPEAEKTARERAAMVLPELKEREAKSPLVLEVRNPKERTELAALAIETPSDRASDLELAIERPEKAAGLNEFSDELKAEIARRRALREQAKLNAMTASEKTSAEPSALAPPFSEPTLSEKELAQAWSEAVQLAEGAEVAVEKTKTSSDRSATVEKPFQVDERVALAGEQKKSEAADAVEKAAQVREMLSPRMGEVDLTKEKAPSITQTSEAVDPQKGKFSKEAQTQGQPEKFENEKETPKADLSGIPLSSAILKNDLQVSHGDDSQELSAKFLNSDVMNEGETRIANDSYSSTWSVLFEDGTGSVKTVTKGEGPNQWTIQFIKKSKIQTGPFLKPVGIAAEPVASPKRKTLLELIIAFFRQLLGLKSQS